VRLIERGVHAKSVNIGTGGQLLSTYLSREDITAVVVQQLLQCLHKPQNEVVLRVKVILILTTRIQHYVRQGINAASAHALYGLLHAKLLVLAGKSITQSSSSRSNYPLAELVPIIAIGARRQLFGDLVERMAETAEALRTSSAEAQYAYWMIPAFLILDIMCQPLFVDEAKCQHLQREVEKRNRHSRSRGVVESKGVRCI
jgi:hypothetical protein